MADELDEDTDTELESEETIVAAEKSTVTPDAYKCKSTIKQAIGYVLSKGTDGLVAIPASF